MCANGGLKNLRNMSDAKKIKNTNFSGSGMVSVSELRNCLGHFFWMIYIKFIMPIFGEEYSEGSQEWTFSIKKEIYCKNFSLLILPTKAFRRFLPKLCAFSPRHQWLGILVIPTHINSQSPENAINPINLASNILKIF